MIVRCASEEDWCCEDGRSFQELALELGSQSSRETRYQKEAELFLFLIPLQAKEGQELIREPVGDVEELREQAARWMLNILASLPVFDLFNFLFALFTLRESDVRRVCNLTAFG